MTNLDAINWPAFIVFDGAADLHYLESAAQWQADIENQAFIINFFKTSADSSGDRLIDASGDVYFLHDSQSTISLSKAEGQHCSVEQALVYVKGFAAQENFCCAAKIYAQSYSELFAQIKSLDAL